MNVEKAIEITEFLDTPPDAENYKFILTGPKGVFWVPPFEAAGGRRWGEMWDQFEDSPTHSEVIEMMGIDDSSFQGAGYCTDGDVQVYTDEPVSKYADQISMWWPEAQFIEWDGDEVDVSTLEWFRTAKVKDRNRKQRKRRQRSRQRNGVPYFYGPWWAGVTNPEAVTDHGGSIGGGSTEQSSGGDFGGGGGMVASVREAVLQRGMEAMGYLGCFWCKRPVEETGTLITSGFYPDDDSVANLVPSCNDCKVAS